MLIPSLEKNSSDTIWLISGSGGGDKEVHSFPEGISPKVNILLGHKIVYRDFALKDK